MNLDSLSFALSQVSYSVTNLTKKNYKQSVSEINHLVSLHGQEAERHLVRCLFSHIDFSGDGKSNNGKDICQIQLLQQECTTLIAKPNAASILCFAIENPLQQQKTLKPSNQLLSQISKILKLNKLQEVVFGIILQHSSHSEIRNHAKQFTKTKFPELIRAFLDTETGGRETGLQEAAVEVLHLLLLHLLDAANPSATSTQLRDQFIGSLRKDFPSERTPVVLSPLLYDDCYDITTDQLNPTNLSLPRSVMETSLADSLREIGYSCSSDKDRCRQTLTQLGGVREVTAPAVSQVLGMMARTTAGLQDGMHMQTLNMPNSLWVAEQRPDSQVNQPSWNVDVFVQVVQEMSPSLNWREVVKEFDHPAFLITSKAGLQLVVLAIRKAMHGAFPVEELYKSWKNSEGQLSWFVHALKNPDVFCFDAFNTQKINVDMLKQLPDDENADIATWRSPELVEFLLKLSDLGHYQQVSELFKFPVQACPDILVLNLLQAAMPWNTLKRELLVTLIPLFLGNHPNSASVLQHIWNCQTHNQMQALRTLMMQCMADWYLRGGDPNDQTRLSRILDVAQDLKALSTLLNASQFTFVVDLACLASRREYLKLDKWLSDKIREHREPFIDAVVAFLKRRCPVLLGMKDDLPMQQAKGQLSLETVGTILAILQPCTQNIQSDELVKDIMMMISSAGPLLSKPRTMPQNVPTGLPIGMPSGIDTAFGALNIGGVAGIQGATTPGGSPAKFSTGSTALPPTSASLGAPGSGAGITSGVPSASMPNLQTMNRHLQDLNSIRGAPQSSSVRNLTSMESAAPTQMPNFSEEVEEEANTYFQRIYNQPPHPTLSIDEVLEMLKRFRDSNNRREREVFSCMLRNLFDENKFFPQYPERELHITALLFGGIIEQGLVQHMALGLALRYVLEALKQESGSKMYLFGIAALDRFKTRLKDCAQYCQHIVTIQHFASFPKHLIEYVEYGKVGQEPPAAKLASLVTPTVTLPPVSPSNQSASQLPAAASVPPATQVPSSSNAASAPGTQRQAGVIGLPTSKMGKPSLAHTTNIDTLLAGADEKEEMVVPPENVQDRVFFIFNNLSQMNMQQKADELLDALNNEYLLWSAQYLVMKRASIEPNFHPLYSSFLDSLKKPELNKKVLTETHRNIKVLLRSDKGVSNFSDRSLLKNLGHWLGLMTLAKNKPILQLDLDMKALLYEAYQKGSEELLYVVPFVAKVLESCEKSRVFKPPNPWTMGILNVLAELHQQHDLKLNLKFEIEVLCKNLHMEVTQLHPSGYLTDPSRAQHIECQLTSRPKEETIHYGETGAGSSLININVSRPVPGSNQESVAPLPGQQAANVPTQPAAQVQTTPQPQYSYNDINVSLGALAPHIQASDHIQLFQNFKQLKQYVRPALERAITELVAPVVDRSMKIALTTCESIIKKDFALDPEEQRMRGAAHHLVRSMTAGMALITCREPLLISISNNLKQAFMTALRGATPAQKEMIEQAAQIIAQDNTELACAFIQKTAVEKAIPEIDKRLAAEFELRYNARQEGRRYCDPVALSYQLERMPEPIRLKVGSASQQQMSVYEEFARQVPGFATASPTVSDLLGQQGPVYNKQNANFMADEINTICEKIANEIEVQLQVIGSSGTASTYQQQVNSLHGLVEMLKNSAQSREYTMTGISLLQKTVESLLEGYTASITDSDFASRYRDCHIMVLKGLQDNRAFGPQWTNKHVTRCLVDCREDYKYNEEAIECLIRNGLVNLPQYDYALTTSMENGLNYMAVAFAMQITQRLIIDEKSSTLVTESDLCNSIEMLAKISSTSRQAPDGLPSLIEAIRQQNDGGLFPGSATGPTSMMQSGINQAKDSDDPKGLHEKVEYLLREWVQMYHSPAAGRDSTKAFTSFVAQMHQQGILKTDDLITRFFRLSTEMCVDLTYGTLKSHSSNAAPVRAKCFQTLDAYVRLIVLLVKLSGDATNTLTKLNLLNKVLGIVAGVLLQDHEVRGEEFQQLPYHRIFIMLFIELNAPEHILETINFQINKPWVSSVLLKSLRGTVAAISWCAETVTWGSSYLWVLTAFVNTYRILRPAKVPGFAFAWLELVSHRAFIGRMLQLTPQQRGWTMYAQLLIDLFKFLGPFLRNADLNRAMQVLYKGTLRVLLVLLHDFPEFLCDYHYAFCDAIPPNCIQMRNLILSAFPRNMRLPDPFTPNLKVDMLTEIAHPPKMVSNVHMMITPEQFKKDLDSYLKTRSPVTFLSDLRSNLQVNNDPGNKYNIPLINCLVLYVGMQAIAYIQNKGMSTTTSTIAHSSHMDIFQNLAVDLDTEGRYLFLNAITNQLRFPNSHTHYFSCVLLYLFSEANSEAIQEQITRVLLERLIVNRPHPWGLLVTFIELIRNQQYKFWSHEFVHCAPEIERLFETVARSCNQTRQQPPSSSVVPPGVRDNDMAAM